MTVGSDFGFEIKLPANWTALSENCHKASRAQEKGTRGYRKHVAVGRVSQMINHRY